MFRHIFLVVSIVTTAACNGLNTQYGPMGLTGGYYDKALNDGTTRITFVANGISDKNFPLDAVFMRATELTLKQERKFFEVKSIKNGFDSSRSKATLIIQILDSDPSVAPSGCDGNLDPTLGVLLPTKGTICSALDIQPNLLKRMNPDPLPFPWARF